MHVVAMQHAWPTAPHATGTSQRPATHDSRPTQTAPGQHISPSPPQGAVGTSGVAGTSGVVGRSLTAGRSAAASVIMMSPVLSSQALSEAATRESAKADLERFIDPPGAVSIGLR